MSKLLSFPDLEDELNMESSIKVITFNVLSSALSTPNVYHRNTASQLDPERRFKLLKEILEDYIHNDYIICLQEVSKDWRSNLETFFFDKGYRFVVDNYNHPYTGCMGVGIAFNPLIYDLEKCKIECIGRTIKDVVAIPKKPAKVAGYTDWLWNNPVGRYFYPPVKEDRPYHEHVKSHSNTMIMLQLSMLSGGDRRSFCIATYHAPCKFWDENIMVSHCVLCRVALSNFFTGPSIMCGDFNIKPGTVSYMYMNGIGPLQVEPELFNAAEKHRSNAYSAYRKYHNTEPQYTTCSSLKLDGKIKPFTGSIDYIWLFDDESSWDESWKVKGAKVVPDDGKCLPNDTHPSDHCLLEATLELRSSQESSINSSEEPSSGASAILDEASSTLEDTADIPTYEVPSLTFADDQPSDIL